MIGSYWGEIHRCLIGDDLPRDLRQNPNLLYLKHPKFQEIAFLYIVPNDECLVRYINCARGPGSGKTVNYELLNAEFASIFDFDAPKRRWFTDAMFGGKFEEIKYSQNLCVVRAVRDIEPGEELFVDYGRNYWESDLKVDDSDSDNDYDNIEFQIENLE